MSVIKSNGAGSGASGGFYNGAITTSLRFPEETGGGYLSRTFDHNNSSSDWTFSTWIKRCQFANWQAIFYSSSTGNPYYQSGFHWHSDDSLRYYHGSNANSGGGTHNITDSSAFFRDASAWYHILIQRDNDGNTVSYVNGTQVASASSSSNLRYINGTTYPHYIGNYTYQSNPGGEFHGYMAETIFVDGSLVAPTSVAETKNGVWIPIKDPSLTYGENGFRLQYLQTGTSANSSGIGADTSGNDHHFTVTSLAAHDVVPDNPENNFATLNPLHNTYASTPYSEGNLKVVGTGSAGAATYSTVASTMELTGKVYFEVYINALTATGRTSVAIVGENYLMNKYGSVSTVGISGFSQAGDLAGVGTGDDDWNTAKSGNASTETTIGYTGDGSDTVADVGDIVQIAYDSATGYAWYGVINRDSSDAQAWFNSGNPANGSGYVGILDTAVKQFAGGIVQSSSDSLIFNFGQDGTFAGSVTAQGNTDSNGIGDFYGTVPSGFVASCSANLPNPTIGPNADTQADDHFKTVIYSGSSGAQTITTGLQPDWIWIKVRSLTGYHNITDTSRGITKELFLNTNDDEENTGRIESSSTTGFTFPSTEYGHTNENGQTFVSWNWHANGGTTTTNDASSTSVGNIDSVIQANTTSGFSIVTYTGNGTNNTDLGIAHGLGVTPKMVWVKNRSSGTIGGYGTHWQVYNSNLSASGTYGIKNLFLNTDGAEAEKSDYIKTTSSTTFTIRSDASDGVGRVNKNGDNYVAYCFAEIEGFSRIGKYSGNGSTDGTYVFTGFKPAWIIVKRTDTADNWAIYDSVRDTFNVRDSYLYADSTAAEATYSTALVDFLSNGFKWRGAVNFGNNSSGTYIYMAFAEAPFKFANAT